MASFRRLFSHSVMSLALSMERQVAVSAVRRACALTSSVFNNLAKNEVLTKDDKSPATGMLLIPRKSSMLTASYAPS
jgi:hypothetical protein